MAQPTKIALDLRAYPSQFYASDYVEGKLTPRQARAARALLDALQVEGARVPASETGKPREIRGPLDVTRWLLERVADQLGLPTSGTPEVPKGAA